MYTHKFDFVIAGPKPRSRSIPAIENFFGRIVVVGHGIAIKGSMSFFFKRRLCIRLDWVVRKPCLRPAFNIPIGYTLMRRLMLLGSGSGERERKRER